MARSSRYTEETLSETRGRESVDVIGMNTGNDMEVERSGGKGSKQGRNVDRDDSRTIAAATRVSSPSKSWSK